MEQVQVEGFPRTYSRPRGGADFGGGLVTFPNLFAIPQNATPNCMDMRFGISGTIEKRLGSTTLNSIILVNSAATGFSPDSGGTLSVGMQVFWKLDETAGTRVDSFGSDNLTDNNSTSFAVGILGNAASFVSANSNNLSLLNATEVNANTGNFSISTWFYLTDTVTASSPYGNVYPILEKRNEYRMGVQVSGVINVAFFQVGTSQSGSYETFINANSFGALSTATWYHLVGWLDSTNSILGVSVNLATNSSSFTNTILGGTGTFTIGASGLSPGNAFFNGRIDETAVYKKVLSRQERSDLFNTGLANTYNKGVNNSGWGIFDFGAGFGADGKPLRWLVVSAGTGIYASSNRGVSFLVIATDRGTDFQFFERSKSLLIATSNTQNKVLYWAGSVGTFMAALPVGSAPPVKQALDFGGFLLLMNDSANKRRVTYADNSKILTDPFTTTFEIPGQLDDEITGAVTYNRSAYCFTRYTVSRISSVGGNPDFAVQQVKSWGAIPGTIKRVTYTDVGEVMIALGWDRHVRIYDGTEDRIISTPIEEPNGLSPVYLNGIESTVLNSCRAELDTEEQVYRLLVAMSPSTQTTHMVCLNLRTGAWYPYRNNQTFNAMVVAESGNSRILTGVTRGGFVHWINTTNTDAGTAIDEYYDSQILYSQTPRTLSKLQKLVLYFSPTSSGTLYFQERVNFAATFDPPRDRIMLVDSTSVTQIRKVIDVPVMQNVYQYRLSSSANTNTPWRLTRFDVEGRDLGIGAA